MALWRMGDLINHLYLLQFETVVQAVLLYVVSISIVRIFREFSHLFWTCRTIASQLLLRSFIFIRGHFMSWSCLMFHRNMSCWTLTLVIFFTRSITWMRYIPLVQWISVPLSLPFLSGYQAVVFSQVFNSEADAKSLQACVVSCRRGSHVRAWRAKSDYVLWLNLTSFYKFNHGLLVSAAWQRGGWKIDPGLGQVFSFRFGKVHEARRRGRVNIYSDD